MRPLIGPLVLVAFAVAAWMLFIGGNPGGLSESEYARFKQLAAPKLLYSCTRKPTQDALTRQTRECAASGRAGCEQKSYDAGEQETRAVVQFAGGTGATTYDELVRHARDNCEKVLDDLDRGSFEVLEGVKQ